jgi:ribosome recycling factor
MADSASVRFEKTVTALKDEFKSVRTGRASPALLDKIRVNYYDTPTPLNQVATVSAPEARLLVVQPFDKTLLGEIEKEIQKADLGLNPSNDGKVIRIQIPPLTGDRKKELSKQAKATAENAKVAIRNIRRDQLEALKKDQKAGKITEDDLKKQEADLQKEHDAFIKQIDAVLADKDKEIMG